MDFSIKGTKGRNQRLFMSDERYFAQHDVTAHLTQAGGREVPVLPHGHYLRSVWSKSSGGTHLGLFFSCPRVQPKCFLASWGFLGPEIDRHMHAQVHSQGCHDCRILDSGPHDLQEDHPGGESCKVQPWMRTFWQYSLLFAVMMGGKHTIMQLQVSIPQF